MSGLGQILCRLGLRQRLEADDIHVDDGQRERDRTPLSNRTRRALRSACALHVGHVTDAPVASRLSKPPRSVTRNPAPSFFIGDTVDTAESSTRSRAAPQATALLIASNVTVGPAGEVADD